MLDVPRHRSARHAALWLGVSTVLATSLAPRAEAAVSVVPPRTRLAVPAGGLGSRTITITNHGTEQVRATVRILDWTIEGGTASDIRFLPPGSTPRSAAANLQVRPEALDLAPGASEEVAVSVTLPPDAAGSYFAAALVEVDGGTETLLNSGVAVRVAINYGHLVTIDTEGRSHPAVAIESFEVSRPDDTTSLSIRATLRNTGDTGLRAEGSFALVGAGGALLAKLPLGARFAQPGGTIELTAHWDGALRPGRYDVAATIDLGGKTVTPEISFEVVDWVEVAGLTVGGETAARHATLTLVNSGNFAHTLQGRLELARAGADPIARELAARLILPGQTAAIEVPLGELPAGPVAATVRLCDPETSLALARDFPALDVPDL